MYIEAITLITNITKLTLTCTYIGQACSMREIFFSILISLQFMNTIVPIVSGACQVVFKWIWLNLTRTQLAENLWAATYLLMLLINLQLATFCLAFSTKEPQVRPIWQCLHTSAKFHNAAIMYIQTLQQSTLL